MLKVPTPLATIIQSMVYLLIVFQTVTLKSVPLALMCLLGYVDLNLLLSFPNTLFLSMASLFFQSLGGLTFRILQAGKRYPWENKQQEHRRRRRDPQEGVGTRRQLSVDRQERNGRFKDVSVAWSQIVARRAERLGLNFMAERKPRKFLSIGLIGSVSFQMFMIPVWMTDGWRRSWKWRDQLGGYQNNSAERGSELELGQEEWTGGECQLLICLGWWWGGVGGSAGSVFSLPSALNKMPLLHQLQGIEAERAL